MKRKSKNTAVFLAIIFGFWTWAYTYKYDRTKFWVGLIITIVLFASFIFPMIVWIWAVVDSIGKDNKFYERYYYVKKK